MTHDYQTKDGQMQMKLSHPVDTPPKELARKIKLHQHKFGMQHNEKRIAHHTAILADPAKSKEHQSSKLSIKILHDRQAHLKSEVKRLSEAKIKADYIDEIEGPVKAFKSKPGHEKLMTKNQAKMIVAKEEVEAILELSKKTLGSYVKKASVDAVTKAIDHTNKPDSKVGKKIVKRLVGVSIATSRLAKEEVEPIEEGGQIKRQINRDARLHALHQYDFGAERPLDKDSKSFQDKVGTSLTKKHGAASVAHLKKGSAAVDKHMSKPDNEDDHEGGGAKMVKHVLKARAAAAKHHGLNVQRTKLKEEAEQIDELSNDTITSYREKVKTDRPTSLRKSIKRFQGAERAEDRINKHELAKVSVFKKRLKENNMISFKDYLKEDHNEYEVLEESFIEEEFISHSDFETKLANHRKNGKILHHDYDHRKNTATIRHVDHEGEVRQFKYSDKGTTVQRLAPMNRGTKDEAGTTVKHDDHKPAVKKRGRPAGWTGTYKKREKVAEETEQIDELSDDLKGRYVSKATDDINKKLKAPAKSGRMQKTYRDIINRGKGIDRVKGVKEEVEQIEEGLRKVGEHVDGDHSAKVYKDNDWNEHRVKFFHKGKHFGEDADAFADNKEDAMDTAKAGVEHLKKHNRTA